MSMNKKSTGLPSESALPADVSRVRAALCDQHLKGTTAPFPLALGAVGMTGVGFGRKRGPDHV